MAGSFLDGLLSGAGRKTGSLMAEQAGLERPYRTPSLLGRSLCSADASRRLNRMRRLIPSGPEIKTFLARLVFPTPIVRAFVFSWLL